MSAVDLTPDERVERVRAALFKAGYPDVEVVWSENPGEPWPGAVSIWFGRPGAPTEAVAWRALMLTEGMEVCWPCWSEGGDAESCTHDPLTSPWPEAVR